VLLPEIQEEVAYTQGRALP